MSQRVREGARQYKEGREREREREEERERKTEEGRELLLRRKKKEE